MLIYNITAAALSKYRDKTVIIRSDEARTLARAFSAVPREKLSSLKILSLDCAADVLLHLSDSAAVDLVVDSPKAEFGQLYRFAELAQRHMVRATIRGVSGMTKAVKIAQALNFSVKLEINQPEGPVVDELITLAEYYLRGSTVTSPIEPFHSLFLSFLSGKPTSLWSLQEEDPAIDRYVTDDGQVTFSKRLVRLGIPEDQFVGFLEQHMSSCLEAGECAACDFFSRCQGYFKVPDKGFCCDRVKRLFALLNEAAGEMRKDEEQFIELHGPEANTLESSRSQPPSTVSDPHATPIKNRSDRLHATGAEPDALSSFSMQRLNYKLEEFTTYSWVNEDAKAVWEPRISKVRDCLDELEWRSILEGVRACALTSVAPDRLPSFRAMLGAHGLTVVSLDKVAVSDVYANSLKRPRDGEPFHHWCVIGRVTDAQLFESAYSSHDDGEIGRLLGYPPCCVDFFNRVWVDEGFIDTTWPMTQNTVSKKVISPTHLEITEVSSGSQLLRWLGLRVAIHLPCSFDCQPTAALAKKLTEVARSAGFHQEMNWLEEMLSWPIEWTALNGLAEIRTPVGTISTVTDATAETYRVSYKGAGSAKARGLTKDMPHDQLNEPFRDLEWYHADNGFSSRQGMDLSHKPILKLAAETLRQATGNVLDLGCGNGVLVKNICQPSGDLVPWGIDISSANIAHAQLLTSRFSDNFIVADIFDDCETWAENSQFQLVMLSLVRLTEVPEERAEKLLRLIREHAMNLLVYVYDGDGSLEDLARNTGLTLSCKQLGQHAALARLEKV
jgi:hypothetical protein